MSLLTLNHFFYIFNVFNIVDPLVSLVNLMASDHKFLRVTIHSALHTSEKFYLNNIFFLLYLLSTIQQIDALLKGKGS